MVRGTLANVKDLGCSSPDGREGLDRRERLRQLIVDLAVVHGQVTLASGKTAQYYVDLRRVTLHHAAAPLVGYLMLDMLQSAGLGPGAAVGGGGAALGGDGVALGGDGDAVVAVGGDDAALGGGGAALGGDAVVAVGGLTLGADPVAAAILHAAASRGLHLDAFVVRKDAKAHGMQRRVEGPDVAGRAVVVVEDTSTTGGSALTAVEAVRQAGAEVKGVAVIVDRATGARELIEASGLPYHALFGLADLGLA